MSGVWDKIDRQKKAPPQDETKFAPEAVPRQMMGGPCDKKSKVPCTTPIARRVPKLETTRSP